MFGFSQPFDRRFRVCRQLAAVDQARPVAEAVQATRQGAARSIPQAERRSVVQRQAHGIAVANCFRRRCHSGGGQYRLRRPSSNGLQWKCVASERRQVRELERQREANGFRWKPHIW